ncbi:MAG: hypothetical protein ACREQW_25555 [Candidatus Binatia bacterium]
MDQICKIRMSRSGVASAFFGAALLAITSSFAAEMHTSGPFKGLKANTGRVIHSTEGDKQVLTLSADFKNPEAPDPHWQVIDSKGNVYMLQKLMIKGDKTNKKIVLPAYIRDVAKVQMWCAFAETNLGEAIFEKPVLLSSR